MQPDHYTSVSFTNRDGIIIATHVHADIEYLILRLIHDDRSKPDALIELPMWKLKEYVLDTLKL